MVELGVMRATNLPLVSILVASSWLLERVLSTEVGKDWKARGPMAVSLKINGPFLKFMGYYNNSMCQKLLFNHTDNRHLAKNGLFSFEMYVMRVCTFTVIIIRLHYFVFLTLRCFFLSSFHLPLSIFSVCLHSW